MAEFLYEMEFLSSRKGHLPAYLLGDQQISLGDVNALANQFAHWLSETLRADLSVVGICAEASLETGALVFGILKAGKVFLGLDPAYPAERIGYMVEQSHCALVITDGNLGSDVFGGTRVITIHEVTLLISGCSRSNPPRIQKDDLPAYVTFTSGSTGRPKAVLAPVRQVDNRFSWMWDAYPFEKAEVCCMRMPLSFVDTIWEILGPICKGTPVAMIPTVQFPAGVSLVERLVYHQVSRIWMLPAAINALVETLPDLGKRAPCLRYWVSTGDALSPAVVAKLYSAVPQARLFNLYGTSEVWDATWYEVPPSGVRGLVVPIGRPIRNVEVCVVDAQRNGVLLGDLGELAISGRGLALGYMVDCPVGMKSFLNQIPGCDAGYYLTQDIGRLTGNGDILFLGRGESIINRGGCLVILIEIEAALTLHPAIMEGAVASLQSGSGKNVISAYYCLKQEHEVQEHDLICFLRQYLPVEALPDRLVRLNGFPMTPSGKINRRLLPDWEQEHRVSNKESPLSERPMARKGVSESS